jgi:uncharacterized protein YgbK (DUF1537 family)
MSAATRWSVAADDRTGAFEIAALIAGVGGEGPVRVSSGAPIEDGVVDLGTRSLAPAEARAAAAAVETAGGWAGHKIDSTLRGNWAGELRARRQAGGRRVVVLPGWPDLGRTCVRGVVRLFEDEVVGDMHQHLPEAALVPHAAGLAVWWQSSGGVAVCDVPDTETMLAMAAVIAGFDPAQVLVAGPAGPLAAVFAAHRHRPLAAVAPPTVHGPALVVCGSASATSHRQVGQLRMAHPEVEVLAVGPAENDELHPGHARELAERARARIAELRPATLVIIGGDTAAAVLGDGPRLVGGMIAPGMPWSHDADGGGPLVITKAGGFGGVDALARLFAGKTV